MRLNERLLLLATSRWTGRIYLVVVAGCCATQTRTGRVAAAVVCGLCCLTLLVAALPTLRELRRKWRDWPDTAEGRAYAQQLAQRLNEENKNKIELK